MKIYKINCTTFKINFTAYGHHFNKPMQKTKIKIALLVSINVSGSIHVSFTVKFLNILNS